MYPERERCALILRLREAIFATAATRCAICSRVNPSGNTTWKGLGIAMTVSTVPVAVVRVRSIDEGVRERRLQAGPDRVVAAADGGDGEPAEAPEDQDEHAECDRAPNRETARVRSRRRPARPRRDHAGAPLAHVR